MKNCRCRIMASVTVGDCDCEFRKCRRLRKIGAFLLFLTEVYFQDKRSWSSCFKNNNSCFSVNFFREFLNDRICIAHEKETVAPKISTETEILAETLFRWKVLGFTSVTLLIKYSISSVFWMTLWNLSQ